MSIRTSCTTVAFCLSLLAAANASAAIRVAVEQGATATSGGATGQSVVNQLNDDTFFDFTATLVDATQLDTAAELANYDVVIFGDSGSNNNDWTPAMAAALKAAVNAGTLGVVSTGWADYGTGNPGSTNMATRDSDLDEVMPIDAYPNHYSFCNGSSTVNGLSTTHPITAGVANFTPTSLLEGVTTGTDATNGVVLGSSSCGHQTVIAGNYGSGRIVYLGLLYMANSSYGVTDLRTGNADRLLEQAVAWAVPSGTTGGPSATAQTVTTAEDTAVTITLAGTDPQNKPLTFAIATLPGKGVLSGTPPNLTYTPNPNANGTDTFTFTVNNGTTTSAPGTVTINVTPVNDAPIATTQTLSVNEDTSVSVTLSAVEPDGDPVSYAVISQPTSGTLAGVAPNLSYTPKANFYGQDSFTFAASDGTLSSTATITINVMPVNDPPIALTNSFVVNQGESTPLTLMAMDPEGDPVNFTVTAQPTHGTLTGTGATVTYTPATAYHGLDSFQFVVDDGQASSAPVTAQIDVKNLAPMLTIMADPLSPKTGETVQFTATLLDPGGDPVTVNWDFGDGASATGTPAIHAFNMPGTITVTAIASDGQLTTTKTLSLNVQTGKPEISGIDGANLGDEGATMSFTANATDPAGGMLSYQWDWGDSSDSTTGESVTHVYKDNGTYPLTLTVTNTSGQTATQSLMVTIKNLPPVVTQIPPETATVGQTLTFKLTATDPAGANDPLTWSLVNGPGAVAPDGTYSWTPSTETPGTFNVVARVNDGDQGSTDVLFIVNLQKDGGSVATGCSCNTQSGSSGSSAWAFVFAAALAFGWRRRAVR